MITYLIVWQTIKYMNNFSANYEKILETLHKILKLKWIFWIKNVNLKSSDIELIAIDLTSEFTGLTPRDLFKKTPW